MENKHITVYTISEKFEFFGKHLPELEKSNWHYYEKEDGTILHFRKEHMVAVEETEILENALLEKNKEKKLDGHKLYDRTAWIYCSSQEEIEILKKWAKENNIHFDALKGKFEFEEKKDLALIFQKKK